MRHLAVVVALALTGCAVWSSGANHVARADRLVADGDLDGALRAYEAALADGAVGDIALRARAGRAMVVAAQSATAELVRVRGEITGLQEQIAAREREIARLTRELATSTSELATSTSELATSTRELATLTRELATREGELARVRQDLTARQAELARLGVEAEKLRGDLEDLKRLEMPLEKRRP